MATNGTVRFFGSGGRSYSQMNEIDLSSDFKGKKHSIRQQPSVEETVHFVSLQNPGND